ncbi:hypothetical protein ACR3K2_24990 [Cryptosporidium serpentis]
MNSGDVMNLYLKIIDRTIEKSRGLQAPEVLEKLRQKWISKLNDYYCGVEKDFSYSITESWNLESDNIYVPKLEGVLPAKVETNNLKKPMPIITSTNITNLITVDDKYEDEEIKSKRIRKDNTDNKELINDLEIQVENNIVDCENSKISASQKDQVNSFETDEDEFGGVEWDIMPTASSQLSIKHEEQINKDNDEDYTYSEQGSNLDDISDLEDEEPFCNDVVVGHFETVARPYSRKKSQKGKWRIKIRKGIAQIGNEEIFFDTLIGEFDF